MKKKMLLILSTIVLGVTSSLQSAQANVAVHDEAERLQDMILKANNAVTSRKTIADLFGIVKQLAARTDEDTSTALIARAVDLKNFLKKFSESNTPLDYLQKNAQMLRDNFMDTLANNSDIRGVEKELNEPYKADMLAVLFYIIHETISPVMHTEQKFNDRDAVVRYRNIYNHLIELAEVHTFLTQFIPQDSKPFNNFVQGLHQYPVKFLSTDYKYLNSNLNQAKSMISATAEEAITALQQILMPEKDANIQAIETMRRELINEVNDQDNAQQQSIISSINKECDKLVTERKKSMEQQSEKVNDVFSDMGRILSDVATTGNIASVKRRCAPEMVQEIAIDLNNDQSIIDKKVALERKMKPLIEKSNEKHARKQASSEAKFEKDRERLLVWTKSKVGRSLKSAGTFLTGKLDDATREFQDIDTEIALDKNAEGDYTFTYDDYRTNGWPMKDDAELDDEEGTTKKSTRKSTPSNKNKDIFSRSLDSTIDGAVRLAEYNAALQSEDEEEDDITRALRQQKAIEAAGGMGNVIKGKIQDQVLTGILSAISRFNNPRKKPAARKKPVKIVGTTRSRRVRIDN